MRYAVSLFFVCRGGPHLPFPVSTPERHSPIHSLPHPPQILGLTCQSQRTIDGVSRPQLEVGAPGSPHAVIGCLDTDDGWKEGFGRLGLLSPP